MVVRGEDGESTHQTSQVEKKSSSRKKAAFSFK